MKRSGEGDALLAVEADPDRDRRHLLEPAEKATPTREVGVEEKGLPKYWFDKEITHDYLKTKLEQREWEGWIMAVFVDSLYLHKSAFEAKDRTLQKSMFDKLNKLARAFFHDIDHISTPQQPDSSTNKKEVERQDVVLGGWCTLLLCSIHSTPRSKPLGSDENCEADEADDKDYPFDEKNREKWVSFRRLQMIWKDKYFMEMFPDLLEKLGSQRRLKLLLAMCVEVPDDVLHGQQFQHENWTRPVKLARGSWNGGNFDEEGAGNHRPPDKLVSVNPQIDRWTWLYAKGYRSKVALFYTEIPDVLVDWDFVFPKPCGFWCGARLDIVKYNMAIMCSNNRWNQFKTPIAQALAKAQWELAQPFFAFKLLLDFLFQWLVSWYLSPVSRAAPRPDSQQFIKDWSSNNHYALLVIVLVGCFGMFLTLLELLSFLWLYERSRKVQYLFKTANFYRIANFLIELFSCYIVISVACDYILEATEANNSVLVNLPFRVSGLVFTKWCQLVLQLMNISFFLDTLLPAWQAMVSSESVSFLLALIVMSVGTALAYFAVPVFGVDGNHSQANYTKESDMGFDHVDYESILAALVRTAKLNFMSEVDYDEFLGEEDGDKTTLTEHFHWALTGFSVVCGLLFPVIALNLYVGVLCVAYDSARKAMIHSEGVLHVTTSARYLLPLKYLPRCPRNMIGCFPTIWCVGEQNAEEQPGTWIAMTEARAREAQRGIQVDPLDVVDTLAVMKAYADDLEELEQVEEKLETQVTRIKTLADEMQKSLGLGEQRFGPDPTQDPPQGEVAETLTSKVDRLASDVDCIKRSIEELKAANSKKDETDVDSIKRSIEELKALINATNSKKYETDKAEPGCWRS